MVYIKPEPRDEFMATIMGLRVQGVGHLVKEPGQIEQFRPRTLQAFALVHLCGGSGLFESAATGSVEIRAGTLFVLFPGIWHRYGPRATDQWREYWTIFDGFIPERYRAAGLLDPARPFFEMGQDAELERRWRECLYLAETGAAGHCQALAERTFALLGHVYAQARVEPAGQSRTRQLVESVVALLEEHVGDAGFRLEEHAARLAMSYSALRQRFAAAAGCPPAQYLSRMRVGRAQARLLAGDEPVKAIAAALGFPDPYHFSRRFKQLVGLSPEAFRAGFRPPKGGASSVERRVSSVGCRRVR